jgi:hypothetical protein
VTVAAYHRHDGHWSSTAMRLAITDPQTAWRRYVARLEDPPATTSAQRVGQAIHALIAGYPGPPDPPLYRCSAKGPTAFEFTEARDKYGDSAVVLLAPEYEEAMTTFDAAMALETPAAEQMRYLMKGGHTEHAIRWKRHGVAFKCLLDKYRPKDHPIPVVVEWKKCVDPSDRAFGLDFRKYGYAFQSAHLRAGVESVLNVKPHVFFCAIGITKPVAVSMHEVNPSAQAWADDLWDARAQQMGEWLQDPKNSKLWVRRWESRVNVQDVPPWDRKGY